MKELLAYLIENLTGSDDFEIEEVQENGKLDLEVKANPDIVGLIIGKGGRNIKNLRKILAIRGVMEEKSVYINVESYEDE